jgi:hypothetical protein
MRDRSDAQIGVLLATLALFVGCARDGMTVIQPSGSSPTAEQTAEYEREKRQMIAERD